MTDLLVIVPSRGRPESVVRVAQAWRDTRAADAAQIVFVIDADDPCCDAYGHAARSADVPLHHTPRQRPLIPTLNEVAVLYAGRYFALGFAGDDHLPRTPGWATRYLEQLRAMGGGIVYGNDGHQGARLPTQWAMTSDIVGALGRMVPAPVEHLYADDSVLMLGRHLGRILYLPDVLIEHMHPSAGKAQVDDGYRRVNAPVQYERDRATYHAWLQDGLAADIARVRNALDPGTG